MYLQITYNPITGINLPRLIEESFIMTEKEKPISISYKGEFLAEPSARTRDPT